MGRARDRASADLNGQEFILDADADTSISADTDDQIDIKIAGADDFAFKANTFEVQTGSNIDMNGTELILDADGDIAAELAANNVTEAARLQHSVGALTHLPLMGGRCVGDDVGTKGSEVTRFVALQTGGSGGCLQEWGRWWGSDLPS